MKCFLCCLGQLISYSLEVSSAIQATQIPKIIELKTDVNQYIFSFTQSYKTHNAVSELLHPYHCEQQAY